MIPLPPQPWLKVLVFLVNAVSVVVCADAGLAVLGFAAVLVFDIDLIGGNK